MDTNQNIEKRFGVTGDICLETTGNETLNTIFNHRSYREFSETAVDPDLMRTLLRAAFSAPSKSDLQQARAIWVRDQQIKQDIANLSPDLQPWIASAPEFIVWCGDNSLSHILAAKHGHPYANNNLDQFMNPAVDAGITMATFIWAAESKGIGCCPVSSIRNTPFELADILSLPKFVFPVAGLVLGYPASNNECNVSMRLPPSVSIMEDRYRQDQTSIIKEVEEYSRRREAQNPTPNDNQRAVEQFGVTEHYGWTEDKTRQYAQPERTDWGDFIRSQGFVLD